MMIRGMALGATLLFATTIAYAQTDASEVAKRPGLGTRSELSDSKIASGLKQALEVGAENAVKATGRPDGYFGNEAIKILLPKNLQTLEKGLRAVGEGPRVDDFILSMNRAAESAAPAAKKIFVDAIVAMSFEDARKILNGGDTAATEYFKSKTTEQLTTAFRPVIEKKMDENGVAQQYSLLAAHAQDIPFLRNPSPNISDYVVTKALDGLFYMLGQEEKKIRKDPLARSTSLLKEVFGK